MSVAGDLGASLEEILREEAPVAELVPRIIRTVCEALGWELGIMWTVDESAHTLSFVTSWRPEGRPESEIERLSERSRFPMGVGLPGRVWSRAEPAWIQDVQLDPTFPRASAAIEDGIHGAFGVPFMAGHRVVGIVEFFCSDACEADEELLRLLAPIGEELGRRMAAESGR